MLEKGVLDREMMRKGAPGGLRVTTECYLQHPKAIPVLVTARLTMPPAGSGSEYVAQCPQPRFLRMRLSIAVVAKGGRRRRF